MANVGGDARCTVGFMEAILAISQVSTIWIEFDVKQPVPTCHSAALLPGNALPLKKAMG